MHAMDYPAGYSTVSGHKPGVESALRMKSTLLADGHGGSGWLVQRTLRARFPAHRSLPAAFNLGAGHMSMRVLPTNLDNCPVSANHTGTMAVLTDIFV